LDAVEREWRTNWRASQKTKDQESAKGAVVIVGNRKQNKFFSNGIDIEVSLCFVLLSPA
jgi:Delta3-Delta2-enoyl-CoA isomerase